MTIGIGFVGAAAATFSGFTDQHAGEEERDMFPEAHKLSDEELKALGRRLERRLQALRESKAVQLRIGLQRELLRRLI